VIEPFGLSFAIENVNPETEQVVFVKKEKPLDFIALKVIEKPLINILWFGVILMLAGMIVSLVRRAKEVE
jgi:cytochrome c-type biogenesis protein CcmF